MSWKRRILELVLAGGTLAAGGCGPSVIYNADMTVMNTVPDMPPPFCLTDAGVCSPPQAEEGEPTPR
jgi:hypothetical protein